MAIALLVAGPDDAEPVVGPEAAERLANLGITRISLLQDKHPDPPRGRTRGAGSDAKRKENVMGLRRIGRLGRVGIGLAAVGSLLLATAAPIAAHEHYAAPAHDGTGQVLANGQWHPRFLPNGDGTFSSCESYGPIGTHTIGPAWYGLEIAHHGPGLGRSGQGRRLLHG